ncbi:MAG: HDIG domain-containing metalloprotein [Bacteroidota bacterium]|nr:HDIG domain-containing metalloprotein [Bacteroidota bacterium]
MQFFYKHQSFIYKVILFLITVFSLVYLFPRSGGFKYNYQTGKPWPYETLLAPFDFPIAKSEEELIAERLAVAQESPLIFTRDTLAEQRSLERTRKWIRQQVTPFSSSRLLKDWDRYLTNLYSPGLIDASFAIQSAKPILVVRDNSAQKLLFSDLKINDSLPFSNESSLLNGIIANASNRLILNEYIESNLVLDSLLTRQKLDESLSLILPTRGVVAEGERIIAQGEVVDQKRFQILNSLRVEYLSDLWASSEQSIIIGYSILVSILIFLTFLFLWRYRPLVYENNTKVVFVYSTILIMVAAIKLAMTYNINFVYVVPLCIVPLLLKTFFDTRLAFFVFLMGLLLIGFMVPSDFSFIFMQLVAGAIATLTMPDLYKRANLFVVAILIVVSYVFCYISFHMIYEGNLSTVSLDNLGFLLINGLGILFVHPLVYVFEKIFGLVSDLSLLELSDTNSKLLRTLSEKAPGTFHHSLQVANIAEAAANEVNANALLVRVGALYHDIGKMNNPLYFSENQSTNYNPHNELDPFESSRLILNHISDGIEIAKRNNLPDRIIDFIRTHHGTTPTRYFYHKAKNENEDVDKSIFCYPGPKPYSKETAILMMADSVEAASKSLQEPTAEGIASFVQKIIEEQAEENQFDEADISLREIELIKKILIDKLINVYHLREVYPE